MDLNVLAEGQAWNERLGVGSGVAIIRHGWLVAEWYAHGAGPDTTFNIHSCTKSFTGTAYGLLFEDSRWGNPPGVDLDTPAYPHIPAGYPLTDPRKGSITLRHLLSMSSGIPGESIGIYGTQVDPGTNPFDAALGRFPLNGRENPQPLWADRLSAEPGTRWDYCDPAFAHLALAFQNLAGQEISQYMQAKVFDVIGMEKTAWDWMGLEDGRTGRHTMPFSGLHLTPREMARFGYLMLRGGVWQGQPVIAPGWIELATRASQPMNPNYGFTWWVNGAGLWPGVPRDAFAAMGFNTNLCCVIPSLDLVVVRLGLGPVESCEYVSRPFLETVSQAVIA
jgi:CubicO group peptidase (beta-lactamase class C family)